MKKLQKMELREYLKKEKYTYIDFAEIIGYSKQYISNVINCIQSPGKKFKKTVRLATKNEVTESDWKIV